MTIYRYRAIDKQGIISSGHISGSHQNDALTKLQEQGLDLLSLHSQRLWTSLFQKDKKALKQEFFTFCLYLEHFSQAELPFLESLQEMKNHFQGPFQGVIEGIVQDVGAGFLFSEALSQHPHIFDSVFISLVEIGEKTGDVSTVFQKLTAYAKQNQETKTRIKEALRYPLLVGAALLTSVMGIFAFLVPALLDFLSVLDIPLSFATQSLIFISSFFPWGFSFFAVIMIFTGITVYSLMKIHQPLRLWIHTLALKIPLIGNLWTRIILTRFLYALGTMLEQGVDVLQGLTIAQRGVNQESLLTIFQDVTREVSSGLSLSQAFSRHSFCTGPLVRMIQIGEETGRLSETLQQMSDLYRKEAQEKIDFLISLLEPVCLGVLGVLLGWIIMATFMPLYESLNFIDNI